jgi:hypothetical protein
MSRTRLEALKVRGADLVRTVTRTTDREEKTRAFRELARVIVDVRENFLDDDGQVDYRGRTWAYRETAAEMFSRANVPSDKVDALQASLRYHVGNELRTRLSPEQLASHGLKVESPRDRNRAVRERTAGVVRLVRLPDNLTPEDALRSLTTAERLLNRLDPETLRSLDTRNRDAAMTLLAAVESHASEIATEMTRKRRRATR